MIKSIITFITLGFITFSPIQVQADCQTLDISSWTQDQVQMGISVIVASNWGTFQSFDQTTGEVCFDGEFLPFTGQDVLDNYQIIIDNLNAANAAQEALEQAAEEELNNNAMMTVTLDQAETWIDNQIDSCITLVTCKDAMKTVFKKIAKFLIAHRDLGDL